jgi:hypothetical protein
MPMILTVRRSPALSRALIAEARAARNASPIRAWRAYVARRIAETAPELDIVADCARRTAG